MKLLFYTACCLCTPFLLYPQAININQINGSTQSFTLSDIDSITFTASEQIVCGASQITYENKTYNIVLVGNQCWLKENLDVGTMIQGSQDATNNGLVEKYCYDNDPNNCTTYGGLYQWNEAMQYVTNEGANGICPPGWHIPRLSEFETLAVTVNWDGNALKREDQGSGAGQGTNTSDFSALMAASRVGGNFNNLGNYTSIWSSTEYENIYARFMDLFFDDGNISLPIIEKEYGFSIRCLKD